MKTAEEIMDIVAQGRLCSKSWVDLHGTQKENMRPDIIKVAHEYAEQFKPKWIDCSDRLPKYDPNNNNRYFVYNEYYGIGILEVYSDLYLRNSYQITGGIFKFNKIENIKNFKWMENTNELIKP